MRRILIAAALLALSTDALADPPELASWLINTTGETGFNGIQSDVRLVQYSADNVYVSSASIPAYDIGPWPGNPNTASDQNYTFRITRTPQVNPGTKTATPLGPIAVLINGVVAFNALDGRSYNNQNVWHQDAVVTEGSSFDDCEGHPNAPGAYHHHLNPRCLYTPDSTRHSPLIGYAFDGFPIYGEFGYVNANGSGGVQRMRSSYRLRAITTRTTLPNGTVLSPAQYGPAVSSTYPLGYYVEDWEYVAGLGDLDAYNHRFTVTPEYPGGIDAYFVTLDAPGNALYPYVLGPSYYGILIDGNTGPTGGHVAPTEPVVTYVPTTGVDHPLAGHGAVLSGLGASPNPSLGRTRLSWTLGAAARVRVSLYDVRGAEVLRPLDDIDSAPGQYTYVLDAGRVPPGAYFVEIRTEHARAAKRIVLIR